MANSQRWAGSCVFCRRTTAGLVCKSHKCETTVGFCSIFLPYVPSPAFEEEVWHFKYTGRQLCPTRGDQTLSEEKKLCRKTLNQHKSCPFNNVKDTKAFATIIFLSNTHRVLSRYYSVDMRGFKKYIPLANDKTSCLYLISADTLSQHWTYVAKKCQKCSGALKPAVRRSANKSRALLSLCASSFLCQATLTDPNLAGWLSGWQLIENMEWEND